MSGNVVVYELSQDDERYVVRVHAAPAAPDTTSVPGPRTFCGRDTFAMVVTVPQPSRRAGAPWYPPQHAGRLCPACDDVLGDG